MKVNQPDAKTIPKLYVATSDLDGPAFFFFFFALSGLNFLLSEVKQVD